ncbi:hypothetical protein ACFQL4_00005, partial [Halosimplex aquaticum]
MLPLFVPFVRSDTHFDPSESHYYVDGFSTGSVSEPPIDRQDVRERRDYEPTAEKRHSQSDGDR